MTSSLRQKHFCTVLYTIHVLLALVPNTNAKTSVQDERLFDQIFADLAPFAAGVSQAMLEDVYCSTIAPGFRVQIRDQEVFIAGEKRGFQSRNRNIKLALLEVASHYQDLPDIDLVIGSDDFSAEAAGAQGPIFAQAKRSNHTAVILFPDHTFTDWQEADTVGWEQQQYIMQKSALHTTWPKKHRQLLFRGSNTTGNRRIASELVQTDWLDIQVWDWFQEPGHAQFVGLPDHCKNKYLLNWPGNTYSARLKYLLLCGSVVVHSDNGWYEFFYPMLKHGQHLMKTKNLEDPSDFTEGLTGLVQHLQANSKKARHIAQAGQEFAEVILSPENVREYWYRLLLAYAEKQTYKVELHSDAIPLGDSLAHPRYADFSPRPGCPSY